MGEFFIHSLTSKLCDVQYNKLLQTEVCKVLLHKFWHAKHPLTDLSDGDYSAGFLNMKTLSQLDMGWYDS